MQEHFSKALAQAVKKLKTSDRFESEVRMSLATFPTETVEEVITHLKTKRLLDDARTAETLVRRYSGKKAMGRKGLAQQLEQRGVDPLELERCLPSEEEESNRLWLLLTSKYKPSDNPMKAGRFLYSRGFTQNQIESALERFFAREAF